MKKVLILLMSVLLIFTATACKTKNNTENEKDVLAVSIVPLSCFADNVCGDDFNVVTIIPSGASPETYEPSSSLMKDLADAKLYFSVGVRAEDSIKKVINNNTLTIELQKKVAEEYDFLQIDGENDPHIWLSVKRAKIMIMEIAKAAGQIKPQNAEKYIKNANEYINKLDEADSYIRKELSTINQNKFITFHPAFAYFADEYSLKMYSLEEDGKEATPKQLAKMVDFAKKNDIKTVFYQSENSSKQAFSFAEEIGGNAVMLEPLSYDYTQNLINMANAISKAVK